MKISRVKGGAIAGSIIIAIVMTTVLSITTTLLVINQIFTEKFISATISNIRIEEIEIPIEIDGKQYDNLGEAVAGIVTSGDATDEEIQVQQEEISKFMDESGFNDMIADVLAEGMDSIMTGDEKTLLTNEDVMEFIEDNEELIEDTFEVEITEDTKSKIEEQLVEAEFEEVFTTTTITNTIYETEDNPIAVVMQGFRMLFSPGVIVAGYVIALLMWIGVFFLNKRQVWYAGPYLAIPVMVVGVGTLLMGVSVEAVMDMLIKETTGIVSSDMFGALTDLLVKIGAIYLVVGIVLLVVSIVLKGIARNNSEQNTGETC